MGPTTHDAIKQFQAANGLEADGWMGPLTAAALDEAMKKLS
jgi:murein L,D-transpeptidase YcbB/YkuD